MKLNEIKELDDGRVLLKNGYFMEPDKSHPDPAATNWVLKRLMDDDTVIATVKFWRSQAPSDYTFHFWAQGHHTAVQIRYRAPSRKMALDGLYAWVEKQLDSAITEDLFADARKARKARTNAAKPVFLHRLNKSGNESGMSDARTYFNTELEAKEYHDNMVKLNPGKRIAHALYTGDGDLTMRAELINGQFGKVTQVRKP